MVLPYDIIEGVRSMTQLYQDPADYGKEMKRILRLQFMKQQQNYQEATSVDGIDRTEVNLFRRYPTFSPRHEIEEQKLSTFLCRYRDFSTTQRNYLRHCC